jgi:hypothetical protein
LDAVGVPGANGDDVPSPAGDDVPSPAVGEAVVVLGASPTGDDVPSPAVGEAVVVIGASPAGDIPGCVVAVLSPACVLLGNGDDNGDIDSGESVRGVPGTKDGVWGM